jgi:hypothetical protein
MLKTALLTLVLMTISIGGGAASVWYALQVQEGVGAVTIDGWTAYPEIGTPEADPYSKARVARRVVLSLGRAEGLSFTAQRDSAGDLLRQDCQYRIEGNVPPSRFWTLYAANGSGAVIASGNGRPAALHSYGLLRAADESVSIAIGAVPEPGNWLPLSGSGTMSLVLTLYDTPIAGSTGIVDFAMPRILKVGCGA